MNSFFLKVCSINFHEQKETKKVTIKYRNIFFGSLNSGKKIKIGKCHKYKLYEILPIPTKLKLEKIFIRKLFFWIVKMNVEAAITGIREKKPGKIEFSLKIKNEINITII